MTVAGWWTIAERTGRVSLIQAPAVTRHHLMLRQWAGVRGREVWGLGVGHTRLFTVSLYQGSRRSSDERNPAGPAAGSRSGVDRFHKPVLLDEALEFLAPRSGGNYLDATLGGGGHAEAILRAKEATQVLGVDRDPDALSYARVRLEDFADRVNLVVGDYARSGELFDLGEGTLSGVLVDLGVSSHQIDTLERGFSFRAGAPLDMRMGGPSADSQSAADLLNELSRDELAVIFRHYGELRRAKRLATAIVERREAEPFKVSDDLSEVVEAVWGRPAPPSDLARVFQALRIAVNREIESLERALPLFRDLLKPQGRLVVISYHSLEDRPVKRAFREWSRDCVCPPEIPVCRCRGRALGHVLTRRPIRPTEEEVARNPRSRSACLRAWEKASDAGPATEEGGR